MNRIRTVLVLALVCAIVAAVPIESAKPLRSLKEIVKGVGRAAANEAAFERGVHASSADRKGKDSDDEEDHHDHHRRREHPKGATDQDHTHQDLDAEPRQRVKRKEKHLRHQDSQEEGHVVHHVKHHSNPHQHPAAHKNAAASPKQHSVPLPPSPPARNPEGEMESSRRMDAQEEHKKSKQRRQAAAKHGIFDGDMNIGAEHIGKIKARQQEHAHRSRAAGPAHEKLHQRRLDAAQRYKVAASNGDHEKKQKRENHQQKKM